jgi:DNA-binding transcriptional LysR family regulator
VDLDNAESAKKMVEEGLGVALLPRVAVAREIGTHQLAQIESVDAPPIQRWVDAIRRKDTGPPSGILAAFLAELQSTLRGQQRRDLAQIAI